MTDHLLDYFDEERRIERRKPYERLRLALLVLLLLVYAAIVLMAFAKIDDTTTMTSPPIFAHWSVRYVISLVALFLVPVMALLPSFLLAFIPTKRYTYGQRLCILFLLITILLESIGCYQLLMDMR